MAAYISHTTIDCRNAFGLSEWWKAILGYEDVAGDSNKEGDEECMIVCPATGHRLLFIEVIDGKVVKNRGHFDLSSSEHDRDAEIQRLLTFGATELADRRKSDGSGWMTMADPEGNEFFVVRSPAERQS